MHFNYSPCKCSPEEKKKKLPVLPLTFHKNLPPYCLNFIKNKYLTNVDLEELLKRLAVRFSRNCEHAIRLYKILCDGDFMFSTPSLIFCANEKNHLPVSCFLTKIGSDELSSILENIVEIANMARAGGGIAIDWSDVRSSYATYSSENVQSPGIMRWINVEQQITDLIQCTKSRKSPVSFYVHIRHPESLRLIRARNTITSDDDQLFIKGHFGVVICDEFIQAVKQDLMWEFREPNQQTAIIESARAIWKECMTSRFVAGYPFIVFQDNVNKAAPEIYKQLGLKVHQSNLCTEIVLSTGKDKFGKQRSAVCVLGSLNLERYGFWCENEDLIIDCLAALDVVIDVFISCGSKMRGLENAVYAATRERSVGLGACGFAYLLMQHNIAFGSSAASSINKKIFQFIQHAADKASKILAECLGPCLDGLDCGVMERFTHKIAIAPTSCISFLFGTSESILPIPANIFSLKNVVMDTVVENPYLQKLLSKEEYEKFAHQIAVNRGSVQSLPIDEHKKLVLRTGFEIPISEQIMHVLERQEYVDQSQSMTLFVPNNCNKKVFSDAHLFCAEAGIKTMYYSRSTSEQNTTTDDFVQFDAQAVHCASCEN